MSFSYFPATVYTKDPTKQTLNLDDYRSLLKKETNLERKIIYPQALW